MKILVVGSGSREHAMGYYLKRGAPSSWRLYFLPGNRGTRELGEAVPLDPLDADRVAAWAAEEGIDLVWVGGEEPLLKGLVDGLKARGIKAFGPPQQAALLEGSKIFAKTFTARHGLPTAPFRMAQSYEEALSLLRHFPRGVAVKADGPAQGKGVAVVEEPGDALPYLKAFLREGVLGEAGRRVVLEERLEGREVSLHGLLFPEGSFLLPLARDHKRLLDGDEGPNTGGMGAVAPVEEELLPLLRKTVWDPLLEALREEGLYYTGTLYVGLMITDEGPKILEFNVRLGDPEAQVLLPLVREPWWEIMAYAREGKMPPRLSFRPGVRVGVVVARRGYPQGRPENPIPFPMEKLMAYPGLTLHPGRELSRRGDRWEAGGGRLLTVTACGKDVEEARSQVYRALEEAFQDGDETHYRRDIGRGSL